MTPPKRCRPTLWISIELEGQAKRYLVADTDEDEQRLRHWLASTDQVDAAHELLDLYRDQAGRKKAA